MNKTIKDLLESTSYLDNKLGLILLYQEEENPEESFLKEFSFHDIRYMKLHVIETRDRKQLDENTWTYTQEIEWKLRKPEEM